MMPLTTPDSVSGTGVEPPLYGTCVSLAPVAVMKRTSVMWPALPAPEVATVTGSFCDSATSSATVLAFTPGFTTIACGARLARPTATKSLSGS
jgi:hypothetical protein